MKALELTLLILAYTSLVVTLFLQIVCYKRNLENKETIALTLSLLTLIIALSISYLIPLHANQEGVLIQLAMTFVAFTTPLNILSERKHSIPAYWKTIISSIALLFGGGILIAFFTGNIHLTETMTAIYLVMSVVGSMVIMKRTPPLPLVAHREKTDRIFATAIIIIIPASIGLSYIAVQQNVDIKVGFTVPLVFILLAGSKFLDDINRLSLFGSKPDIKQQHFINYNLTKREQEIATKLCEGASYAELSDSLFISLPTVKTHASNIYKKCGVKNRSELMILLNK